MGLAYEGLWMVAEIINAVAADVLALYGLPVAGTTVALGATAWRSLIAQRVAAARDILTGEMSRGTKALHDVAEDEVAAVTFRYMRAAIEGTARLNLRLMAATASGQAHGAGLYADDFLRWADLIASLRREEVIVLATLYREWVAFTGPGVNKLGAWRVAQTLLAALEGMDEKTSDAVGTACLRTGLIQIATGSYGGGQSIFPTGLLGDFMSLADVEGVLRRHQADQGPKRS
ncbi:hypothetical protein WH91_01025 [Devosia psychrophila]|uniref:Uncharacterized protein n=1 Tax=Devosia psychrophila TaxID=728005 RepID=A0A0F5Q2H5_9HYPH|nr:hypothetical protein WH91_01025 [Devosia psychrophila]SFC10192.1 hypothetical protein SAMN04488059_102136 [Devosia psychrophila]